MADSVRYDQLTDAEVEAIESGRALFVARMSFEAARRWSRWFSDLGMPMVLLRVSGSQWHAHAIHPWLEAFYTAAVVTVKTPERAVDLMGAIAESVGLAHVESASRLGGFDAVVPIVRAAVELEWRCQSLPEFFPDIWDLLV